MTRVIHLAIAVSVLVCSLAAQVNERELRRRYSAVADGIFVIEPGVRLRDVFDKQGEACALTLHGEISEDQVLQNFDVLLPARNRGLKKLDLIEEFTFVLPPNFTTYSSTCVVSVNR